MSETVPKDKVITREGIISEAEQNITRIRQVPTTLSHLKPLTAYRVEMHKHSFPFGTVLSGPLIRGKSHNPWVEKYLKEKNIDEVYVAKYLEFFQEHFSGAVIENDFKWQEMTNEDGSPLYLRTDTVMAFIREYPELMPNFRGHTIFWNRRKNLPIYLQNASKKDIQEELFKKRLSVLQKYPDIPEWDIINEPLKRHQGFWNCRNKHNEIVFDPVSDIDVFADLILEAHKLAPATRLYINEYSILSGRKTDDYIIFLEKLTSRLREKGLSNENMKTFLGIGIQGHITTWDFASIPQAKTNLDKVALLGLPIKITEFDVSDEQFGGKVQQRAEYMRDMLTLFYGHSAITGIYLWGFDERMHWRKAHGFNEHPALTDSELRPNAVGEAFFRRIHHDWRTDLTTHSNEDGKIAFVGFPGSYKTTELPTISREENMIK
ncbi:MAG: endo-1,4-beta-xylanase [bacterium]|nr:endo-1,4-beta-xylanase [bacterium]